MPDGTIITPEHSASLPPPSDSSQTVDPEKIGETPRLFNFWLSTIDVRTMMENLAKGNIITAVKGETLKSLRDPSKVSAESYGKGCVNACHNDQMTIKEHEEAQRKALDLMWDKIERGLVEPLSIGADIVSELGLKDKNGKQELIPQTFDEIKTVIDSELTILVENQHISDKDAQLIGKEIDFFIGVYRQAFPEANAAKVCKLARDNARKLAYQQKMDKRVFSGSDHGLRHIVNGDIKFARQMIESLRTKGVKISARDETVIYQTIYDHDLGYTTGAAMAPRSYEAMKDHPLFSADFILQNKQYYVQMYGEEGYSLIYDAVLNHSYVRSDFNGSSLDLIRSVTSTADSLGVTAETKAPEFFTKPEAVRVLLKIRLAMETVGKPNEKGQIVLDKKLLEKYKDELRAVAREEQNQHKRESFLHAIEYFFNEITVENILGQYTGVVNGVSFTIDDKGRLIPQISMEISQLQALLGNMFGGKLETAAFAKLMRDYGLKDLQSLAQMMESVRRKGNKMESLTLNSTNAVFIITDIADLQFIDIQAVFDELAAISIRSEINHVLEVFNSETDFVKKAEKVLQIAQGFESLLSTGASSEEIAQLRELIFDLLDYSASEILSPDGKKLTKSEIAREKLRYFLTSAEKQYLGL